MFVLFSVFFSYVSPIFWISGFFYSVAGRGGRNFKGYFWGSLKIISEMKNRFKAKDSLKRFLGCRRIPHPHGPHPHFDKEKFPKDLGAWEREVQGCPLAVSLKIQRCNWQIVGKPRKIESLDSVNIWCIVFFPVLKPLAYGRQSRCLGWTYKLPGCQKFSLNFPLFL